MENDIQPLALVLLHETEHTVRFFFDRDGYYADQRVRDDVYTDREEKRIILGPEAWAAIAAGEPTRNCHCGTPVKVSVTYSVKY